MCSIINLKVFQGLAASFPEMVFLVNMLGFVFDILEQTNYIPIYSCKM